MKGEEARKDRKDTGIRKGPKMRDRGIVPEKREDSAESFGCHPKRVGRILVVRELMLERAIHITATNRQYTSQHRVLARSAKTKRPDLVEKASEIAGIPLSKCGVERAKHLGRGHPAASAVDTVKNLPQDAFVVCTDDRDRDLVFRDDAGDLSSLVDGLVLKPVIPQLTKPIQQLVGIEDHRHGEPMRRGCSARTPADERVFVEVKVELELRCGMVMLDQ